MIEIHIYNYWEHIKAEKELARVVPPDNPIRVEIRVSANEILEKIKQFENRSARVG